MVALYVGGEKVAWADAGEALAGPAFGRRLELRDATGAVVARIVPEPAPARDDEPDWLKAITPEAIEIARRGPFFSYEEVKKQLGWE